MQKILSSLYEASYDSIGLKIKRIPKPTGSLGGSRVRLHTDISAGTYYIIIYFLPSVPAADDITDQTSKRIDQDSCRINELSQLVRQYCQQNIVADTDSNQG